MCALPSILHGMVIMQPTRLYKLQLYSGANLEGVGFGWHRQSYRVLHCSVSQLCRTCALLTTKTTKKHHQHCVIHDKLLGTHIPHPSNQRGLEGGLLRSASSPSLLVQQCLFLTERPVADRGGLGRFLQASHKLTKATQHECRGGRDGSTGPVSLGIVLADLEQNKLGISSRERSADGVSLHVHTCSATMGHGPWLIVTLTMTASSMSQCSSNSRYC